MFARDAAKADDKAGAKVHDLDEATLKKWQLRLMLVDLMCTAFSAFFAWKSWTLFHEAWAEGQSTSSSWAPPLWIPYGLMALGMTLLSLQLLVQLRARVNGLFKPNQGAAA